MNKYKNKLYCFSPPVMVLTFLFEIVGALYVLWKYKKDKIVVISATILFCLAIFQVAEYYVCAGSSFDWARVGFVAITLLPPLGLHLAASIAGSKKLIPFYSFISYMTAFCFIGFFIFYENAITSQLCGGNYIIFGMSHIAALLYAIYYFGWLLIGVVMCLIWGRRIRDKKKRSSLNWLCVGYLAFILPTATANMTDPHAIKAIPSIMCGFAILLAIIILFKVLPPVATKIR